MNPHLNPCPFCGGTELRFAWSCRESVTSHHPKDWYQFSSLINCRGCSMQKHFGSFINADCELAKRGAYNLAVKGWNNRAALAQAAAAVVMPERKQWDATAGTAENMKSAAWNSALDEVARLNRRAIPEGLIEASRRAADILGSQGFAAWDQLAAELRALLGKGGET